MEAGEWVQGASRSPTFVFSALIWSNILGVVGMVAFGGFRSIAMINLAGG